MLNTFRASTIFLGIILIVTGFLYPVTISLFGQVFFPSNSAGSLIMKNNKVIGSELIGQEFKGKGYFYSRPSYAGDGYDAAASAASNFAISNNELVFSINQRTNKMIESSSNKHRQVPIDMVTSSASGLDPHISMAAAYYQVPRIARERKIPGGKVQELLEEMADRPWLGIFGEDKVNVLLLNMKLDELEKNLK